MRLSVKKIIHTPGEKIGFDFNMDLSDLEFGGAYPVVEPVRVEGQVVNKAGMLLLNMNTGTTLHCVCDRCMSEFDRELVLPSEYMLAEEVQDEENDDILLLDQGEVDLADLARTVFILGMDTKTLCSEDCQGLCFRCGANLNEGSCQCKPDIDPRWASLAQLLEKK